MRVVGPILTCFTVLAPMVALVPLAIGALACGGSSSGGGSGSGPGGSTGSCTVTLSGAVTGTGKCTAEVLVTPGQSTMFQLGIVLMDTTNAPTVQGIVYWSSGPPVANTTYSETSNSPSGAGLISYEGNGFDEWTVENNTPPNPNQGTYSLLFTYVGTGAESGGVTEYEALYNEIHGTYAATLLPAATAGGISNAASGTINVSVTF